MALVSFGVQNSGSGGSGGSSGIQSLNGNAGPSVLIEGVNGISVSSPVNNRIVIDVASLSGISTRKFAANFFAVTSGLIQHNLQTQDVIVSVRDSGLSGIRSPMEIIPDRIVYDDENSISLIFNVPQNGRVVVIG